MRTAAKGAAAVVIGTLLAASGVTAAHAVQSTVPAAPNPPLTDSCAMDLAISVDLSNSVTDDQLQRTRSELAGLASALEGYPVRLAVHNFASNAPATTGGRNAPLPLTSVRDAVGVQQIADHVNAIQRPTSAQGGTNWDRAFAAVAASEERYDALLFLTDGNPTQYGSPARGPGSSTDQLTIDASVSSANSLKAEETRVIAVGVADNLTGAPLQQFREHISQVSGPAVGSDYILSGFSTLQSTLLDIINTNCASVDLTKSGSLAAGATGAAGDLIEYGFRVTNDGGVTLTNVTLTDAKPGLSAIAFGAWPGTPGVLAPGQSVDATATYALTAEDVAAGAVDNTARVSGVPPAGSPVADEAPARVELPELLPGISLVKTGVLEGETISYEFVVTNTGSVTLSGVTVSDELPGLSEIAFGEWPGAAGVLAPGQQVTATASYALTQADRDAGSVVNTATVTGTPPTGGPVQDEDVIVVDVPAPGQLPVTGTDAAALGTIVLLAMLALAGGTALTVRKRRTA